MANFGLSDTILHGQQSHILLQVGQLNSTFSLQPHGAPCLPAAPKDQNTEAFQTPGASKLFQGSSKDELYCITPHVNVQSQLRAFLHLPLEGALQAQRGFPL